MRNLCASTPDSFVCQFVVNFFFVFPRLLSALSFLLNVSRLRGNPWDCVIGSLFENPSFHLLLETRPCTLSRRKFRFVIKKYSGESIVATDSRMRETQCPSCIFESPWGQEVIRGNAKRGETAEQESCQDSTIRRRSRWLGRACRRVVYSNSWQEQSVAPLFVFGTRYTLGWRV